jgi:cell division septum initiation protein DivIVA
VTTPDPSATVPVPDPGPAPVDVVPKPDPGPVKVVPKAQPPVVHPIVHPVVHPVYQAPVTPAPVVVQPSVTPARPAAAKPRVKPKHVAAHRKQLVKPKQTAPAQVTKPKPAAAKPKPHLPTITLQHASARKSGGWMRSAGAKILLGALSFVLLVYVVFATRRARRSSGVAIAADAAGAGTSPNGSSPAPHDEELAFLELELKRHAERADALAAEVAQLDAAEAAIPEALLTAQQTANELRDSATVTLRKARRLADRIVEEAARRRTRLEARNASLKLELEQLRAREALIRDALLKAQETAHELPDGAEVDTLLESLLEHVADGGLPATADPSIVY